MNILKLVVVMLVLTGCAHQDEWSQKDTRRQWAITGLMVIDAHQTAQIQYDPMAVEGHPLPLFGPCAGIFTFYRTCRASRAG